MILPATEDNIACAVKYLKRGALVVLPTETVYGLGADATNGIAVAGIFAAKGRPHFNPLIVHVSDAAMARRYGVIDPLSWKLMEHFWPGPLTLVLPLRERSGIHPLVTAWLPTLAMRSPQGIFSGIIATLDVPIAAPSANHSGKISPTTAAAVADDLGAQVPLILDGGPCPVGVESTIVKVAGDEVFLLRPGGAAREEIEKAAGRPVKRPARHTAVEAPGMLESHYAPHAAVRLEATEVHEGEALLAFGLRRAEGFEKAVAVLNLSPAGDVREAAARLFDCLRTLDRTDATCIVVEPVPMKGLGEAINDRLARAAASRTVK